jgi:hypothetical protein
MSHLFNNTAHLRSDVPLCLASAAAFIAASALFLLQAQ